MNTSSFSRSVGSLPTLFCFCTLLIVGTGCDTIVWEDPPGSARAEHMRLHTAIFREDSFPVPSPSTKGICFTTVEFPQGYDWRRDTLYGAIDAQVCLYRDGSRVTQVPTGRLADAASDKHHYVDGHLYTECHSGSITTLACDGEEVMHFPGVEILKGIVPLDNVLYTLWQTRGGQGVCLRCGGEEVFRRSGGTLAGSLEDHSYLPYGALYPNSGDTVFCYCLNGIWYCVRNGEESSINMPEGKILDIKFIGNNHCVMYVDPQTDKVTVFYCGVKYANLFDSSTINVQSGRIYIHNNRPEMVCDVNTASGARTAVNSPHGSSIKFAAAGCIPLSLDNSAAGLGTGKDGSITIAYENRVQRIPGEYFLFGVSPGLYAGGKMILALNPKSNGKKPVLWEDGTMTELAINGFISGIYTDSQ